MKRYYTALVFFLVLPILTAEKNLYKNLLEYRLTNDNSYKYLQLEKLIAQNNYQKMKNNAAAVFTLGSGNMNFIFSKDSDKRGFSLAPYADLSFPLLNNTGLKISAPYKSIGGIKESGISAGLSAELYGTTRRQTKLVLGKAAEAVRKAEKEAARGLQIAEKKLLKDIQNLFSEYAAALDKEIEDTKENINYEKVKAQGYAEDSSKMRVAKLSLLTAGREKKQANFSFSVTYKKFLKTCGLDEEKENNPDIFLSRLANSLPDMEVLSIEHFSAEDYVPIKEAKRNFADNAEERSLSVSPFSLSAEGGYSYKNLSGGVSSSKKHSASAGLSMALPGTKLSAGVNLPIGAGSDGTSFTLGISFSPLAVWNYALDRKTASAKDKIDSLKLNDLINSFDIEFKTLKIKGENAAWQKKVLSEELSIYFQNNEDHKLWFNKGFASAFEKMQAELEYKKAVARLVNAKINCSIFNMEISSVFEKTGEEEPGNMQYMKN